MNTGKQLGLAGLALLLSLATATGHAGMYVSGGIGLTEHDFVDVGHSSGYVLGIGYRPEYGPLGIEVGYLDTGSAPISGIGNLEMSGSTVVAVWWMRNWDPQTEFMSGYLKLGLYDMTATDPFSTVNSTGWRFGMGFEFRTSRNLAIYTDVDGYGLVDTPGGSFDNLTIWSAGLRYHF